jgi:hypothetical protein
METRFTPISIGASLGQAVDALLATAQHEFSAIDAFGKPDWRRAMTARAPCASVAATNRRARSCAQAWSAATTSVDGLLGRLQEREPPSTTRRARSSAC